MRESSTIRPKILEREVVHKNDFYHISRVDADFGDFTKHYYVSEHGERVGLVVTRGNDVLLVRQYRFLLDGLSWEIPGGGVREGEDLEKAAIRECREETGVVCRSLTPLVNFHQGLDAVHNFTHVFYATDFTETGNKLQDVTEASEHHWVAWEQCIDMISTGKIADSFTIASLLSFRTLVRDGSD